VSRAQAAETQSEHTALEAAAEWPAASPDLRLRVWAPEQVRRARSLAGHLEIYHDGPPTSRVEIESLEIRCGEDRVWRRPCALVLHGDGGLYGEIDRLLELVPPATSKRFAHRRLPLDAHRADPPAARAARIDELRLLSADLARGKGLGASPPTGLVPIELDLAALLEPRPGASATFRIEVHYRDSAGRPARAATSHSISLLPPFSRLPLPAGGRAELPGAELAGAWAAGDLHVHDCKDEAGFWRGCPTCQAESLNWGDENSLRRLKNQYAALGADWFSSTSHSYCLESSSEYDAVAADAAALNAEGGVLIVPGTELTSGESGPRSGCPDLNDIICALDGGVNHIGAHFITSWKAGGTDLGGGYCYHPIYELLDNIAAIRAEGGFSLMNHPCHDPVFGGALTSNSDFALTGVREDGLYGAEIWSGSLTSGQDGHVAWWVDRMLDGLKLYAYSGSDTHDDAFDHGWNHVYVWPTLTLSNLSRSLQMGLSYISNHQYLALAGRLVGGTWIPMGGDISVPLGGGESPLEIVIGYDMNGRTGSVDLYRGQVGDAAEQRLATFDDITGSGYLFVSDDAPNERGSYYRAYSVAPGSPKGVAYSNPVWVEPR